MQQPGKKQVPGLQERYVFIVLDFARGEQPGGLQVQEGGGDDEELAGLVEGPLLPQLLQVPDVLDELIGHSGKRHLGDVELMLGDQGKQEVEGAGEVRQPTSKPDFRTSGGVPPSSASACWPPCASGVADSAVIQARARRRAR